MPPSTATRSPRSRYKTRCSETPKSRQTEPRRREASPRPPSTSPGLLPWPVPDHSQVHRTSEPPQPRLARPQPCSSWVRAAPDQLHSCPATLRTCATPPSSLPLTSPATPAVSTGPGHPTHPAVSTQAPVHPLSEQQQEHRSAAVAWPSRASVSLCRGGWGRELTHRVRSPGPGAAAHTAKKKASIINVNCLACPKFSTTSCLFLCFL